MRSGTVIDSYRNAECVPPSFAKDVSPPTRGWDATLAISETLTVTVKGADMVDGRIVIRHEPNGPEAVVVERQDYIYPSDVRLDKAKGILLVKASGLALGVRQETWLYEYDLKRGRQLAQILVDPSVLPPECAMPESKQ